MDSADNFDSLKEQIKQIRKEQGGKFLFWLFKANDGLRNRIKEFGKANNLDSITNESQLLYHFVNGLKTVPKCKVCGNEIQKFGVNSKWEYNSYCNRACVSLDPDMVRQRSLTRAKRGTKVSAKLKELEMQALGLDCTDVNEAEIVSFLKAQKNIAGKKILFLHNHPKWFKFVLEKANRGSFEEGVYCLLNPSAKRVCNECGKRLDFVSIEKGFGSCKTNDCIQNKKKHNLCVAEQRQFLSASADETKKKLALYVSTLPLNSFKQTLRKADFDVYKNVFVHCKLQREDSTFAEKVFSVLHDVCRPPKCQVCHTNDTKFQTLSLGYKMYCGSACAVRAVSEERNERGRQTIRSKNYEVWSNRFSARTEQIVSSKEEFVKTGCLTFKCSKCNTSYERTKAFNVRCPQCRKVSVSFPEHQIGNYVEETLGLTVIRNSKRIIPPLELDLFVSDKKIAIEFDGLYWHSDERIDKNYHLNKTLLCQQQGIQLIHVFENEWVQHPELIKSMIANKLGLTPRKIYARKCTVREIDTNVKNDFLFSNHIQGPDNSKYRFGLFFEDELVAVMTFGKRKITGAKPALELMRFCNKQFTTVVGGASKLFDFFVKTYSPSEIISYANRRFSNGNLYKSLGFTFSHASPPNYWYFDQDRNLRHRTNFQKHKLRSVLGEQFNPEQTEHENMKSAGFSRIWDCGNLVFRRTF